MKPQECRSVQELARLSAQGARPKYMFFWGHKPQTPGVVDQSCFSNWYAAGFSVEDQFYPTMEHYMMAEKARLFDDMEMLHQILIAKSPAAAKRLGRKVRGFEESTWEHHRVEIVVEGLFRKFSLQDDLKMYLLGTGKKVLAEASPHDRIWGIGMKKEDTRAKNPCFWKGLNLLGFALMDVREELKK